MARKQERMRPHHTWQLREPYVAVASHRMVRLDRVVAEDLATG